MMPLAARFLVRRLAVATTAALSLAGRAEGQTIGKCPPTCAGTGFDVYSTVEFGAANGGNWYNLGPTSFFLDRAFGDENGSARGIVDLRAGTLKAGAASYGLSGAGIIVLGVDRFTVSGPTPGADVLVTANLVASGSALIQSPFASMQAMIQLGMPGGANDFDRLVFQAPGNAPLNTLFPVLLTSSFSFIAPAGSPFDMYYFLRLESGNGAGSHLDFLDSAHLSFELPTGATIASVGGFGAAVAAVPEPAALGLVAAGLLVLGAGAARRRRRR